MTARVPLSAPSPDQSRRYRNYCSMVYIYTFLSYCSLHILRKCYANLKMKLEKEAAFDSTFLSVMDTVFMLFYATGSAFSGRIGDLFSLTTIIAIGLIGSSICMIALASIIWLDIERSQNEFLRTFCPLLIWLFHGLLQSTGGPSNTKIMSSWFPSQNRGLLFGTWTCHQYVGNIIASLVTVLFLSEYLHVWSLAFIIPSLLTILWGIFIFYNLPESPESVPNLSNNIIGSSQTTGYKYPRKISNITPSLTILEAIKIPNVIWYALAFGLFKFVNYTMFFWLPFYLSTYFSAEESNLVSILYDVGMIPGGIMVGWISDVYGGRRACVIATFTIVLCPCLLIFASNHIVASLPVSAVMSLLGVMGCLIGGPINIITSAVAIDLAENSTIGGRNDLMTVTGIINAAGSIMASFGLAIVGPLSLKYGWQYVWYTLTFSTLLGTALLSPAIIKELRIKKDNPRKLPTQKLNPHSNYSYGSISQREEQSDNLSPPSHHNTEDTEEN